MTTLLTIVTAALILIIINQININRTNKSRIIDLEAQNKLKTYLIVELLKLK